MNSSCSLQPIEYASSFLVSAFTKNELFQTSSIMVTRHDPLIKLNHTIGITTSDVGGSRVVNRYLLQVGQEVEVERITHTAQTILLAKYPDQMDAAKERILNVNPARRPVAQGRPHASCTPMGHWLLSKPHGVQIVHD
jgi:hypothetical protein